MLALVPVLLVAAACGSDGDSTDGATDDDVTNETAVVDDDSTDTAADNGSDDTGSGDDTGSDDAAPPASGGGATLTLANGESFEFPSVLCTLEPQMAAGSEILFTATSYDDPGLDITQFGDEGTINGVASIDVYDADFETLWSASSMFGYEVELTLDGSTIRGTGSFLPGPDLMGEPVQGEVVANC